VAIKMMRPELALDPEHVRRFLREAYTANRVEHPGVVAVLDDDIAADGTPFLVMERLEGETLGTKVRRDGPLGYAEALKAVDTALDVLAAAHAKDIVHRDVKPDNLFVCNDGTLRVLDFGLARSRDAGDDSMTRTGTQMGTVGYVSPEQARGQHDALDARSDVWSVGATLYTLLTGCILHRESTSNEGFLCAMSTPVRPMRELAPHVPASLARLLDTALAFDPSERFASGAVMRAALAKVDINDAPVSVPTPRRWRRALAVALCAACAGLGASLGFPDAVSVPVRRAREVSYARATRAEVASAPRKAVASLGRAAVRPSADVPVRTLPAEPVRDPYALRK
jgi:serine/threonine-protein kinase